MTERIDLDDVDAGEPDDGDESNEGDWIWRDEGDDDAPVSTQSAADAPVGPSSAGDGAADDGSPSSDEEDAPTPSKPASSEGGSADASNAADASGEARVPHVPRESHGSPAGIPKETGGAGAGSGSGGQGTEASNDAGGTGAEPPESAASGPHGGGVDEMATAFTYEALKRLSNPAAAVADAKRWSDWIGIVGDVPAHVIGTFQREHGIDADFFNGTGTGPGERLAGIDEHSMFYSERMVVVGVAGEEPIAEEAGWEFVPLADAAANAGWDAEAGSERD
ncbi:hypothetical protein G9464_15220 [Halostella sp. JP-L12]|uniref:DUF7124 domain-containing protein n=1 Tax=Halostella TaxID=1843185 RepID=UPI000EF79F53|nr:MULTISPECIES: hypothetical protein [Halostella]NHN48937.1 hypothetical protein [Halostella sp. JP-L12]